MRTAPIPKLGEVFRCQATEALRATTPLPEKALSQYVREVRVGNVGVGEMLRVGSSALAVKMARKVGLRRLPSGRRRRRESR